LARGGGAQLLVWQHRPSNGCARSSSGVDRFEAGAPVAGWASLVRSLRFPRAMKRRHFLRSAGAVGLLSAWAPRARAAALPKEIRIGVPGAGVGNRPSNGGSVIGLVHARGMLEKEFAADGIPIRWNFLRGTGPAINECFANGLLDVASQGDLPNIVGRAGGLATRFLISTGRGSTAYLGVPAGSSAQGLKDLLGKRVALPKGTYYQLVVNRVLEGQGLGERDFKIINMETAAAKAALVTGDIDAAWGGSDFLQLQDQGAVRVLYSTKGDNPKYLGSGGFLAHGDFHARYPDVVQRIVTTYLRAAHWTAEQEKSNRDAIFQLWAKSGTPYSVYKREWEGVSMKSRNSPLVDDFIVEYYRKASDDAKRFGLIRNTFDLNAWWELGYLQQGLRDLGLTNYWQPQDKEGKPKVVAVLDAK
jgi:sulfonate transport system substrate-binding protein